MWNDNYIWYKIIKKNIWIYYNIMFIKKFKHNFIISWINYKNIWRHCDSKIMTTFYNNNVIEFSTHWFSFDVKSDVKMKICFYVNKNIDLNEWKIEFSSSNIYTLKMRFWSKNKTKWIHIHNVYNFFLILYLSMLDKIFVTLNIH